MAKKGIFVSFDYDKDKTLKEFVIGQARSGTLDVDIIDFSLKEAAPMATWEQKARTAIKRSDLVLVMVGSQTYKAPGVLKEVKIAREERIPIVQMIGYKDSNPTPVPNAGRLYRWTRENLENLFGK